jgi:hypothetical protein
MTDDLELVESRKGFIIRECLAKLRFFCERDAYPDYDRIGYQYASDPNRLQAGLLTATNRAMRARAPRKAWAAFLDRPLPELTQLPVNADLVEAGDADYASLRAHLGQCYRVLTATKWITDMSATKMLYLKRPRLVAISDSYVRDVLAVPKPDPKQHPWRVEYCTTRALWVSDAVRAVGRHNRELLDHLLASLAETVGRIAARCETPMSLSKARAIDILLWVDAAIALGHKTWKPVADAAGWHSILLDIRGSRT